MVAHSFSLVTGGSVGFDSDDLAGLTIAPGDSLAIEVFKEGDGILAGDSGQLLEDCDIELRAVSILLVL